MRKTQQRLGWKLTTWVTGALTTYVTQRALVMVWKRLRPDPPPENLADPSRGWTPAIAWAIASGVGIGVARVIALRSAERVWEAATHEAPPGVDPR
jgi:hypothetical protein